MSWTLIDCTSQRLQAIYGNCTRRYETNIAQPLHESKLWRHKMVVGEMRKALQMYLLSRYNGKANVYEHAEQWCAAKSHYGIQMFFIRPLRVNKRDDEPLSRKGLQVD